jgi:hypothetical protein
MKDCITKTVSVNIRREEITVERCDNPEADKVFVEQYWMKQIRRSRRISYVVILGGKKVAWIQCADLFGTKLTKRLQRFDINEAVEVCRGYFIDDTPRYIESCAISKVLNLIPNEWYSEFKVIKKIAIIYQDIDAFQKGIVYKALGFSPYGLCTHARHYSKAKHGNSRGNKIVWARSLHPVCGMHYKIIMPNCEVDADNSEMK